MTVDRNRQAANGRGEPTGGRRRLLFRRSRRLVSLTIAAFVVYIVGTFIQVLVVSTGDESAEASGVAEAAIVLGAAQYNGRPSEVFKRRLDHAVELYEDELVPRIVVTGGAAEGDRYTEAYSGLTYLIRRGVPDEDVIVVDDGASTWESLAASGRVLRSEGIDHVVLVSDPYHSLRLKGIADEIGLDALVSPTESGTPLRQLVRETGAVSLGRIIGYRRMVNWIG
ncbi:MAG: YdcF family protein [Actinobacteria bacterium]|nr:YdcF family protein [Actinomycetota bacterium]